MDIIVDDRNMVAGGYANGFDREGVSSAGIEASEFREWIAKISDTDMNAVEAFWLGVEIGGGALATRTTAGPFRGSPGRGRGHHCCASMSVSRLRTRWVYSPPGRRTSCESRSM